MSISSGPGRTRRSVADAYDEMHAAIFDQRLRNELDGLIAAIVAACRIKPEALPAAPDRLAAVVEKAVLDLKCPHTLDALRAIAESGPAQEVIADWKRLITALTVQSHRFALRPFAKYCMQRFIAPAAVNDRVLTQYRDWIRSRGQVRWPRQTASGIARAWNAQAGVVAGWPQTKLKH